MSTKPEALGDPIARKTLSDLIIDRLLQKIKSGDLAPGDVFPSERDQMDFFHVGRPSIREAMQTLGNWGLARTIHGLRSEVSNLEPADVLQAGKKALEVVLLRDPLVLRRASQEVAILRSSIAAAHASKDFTAWDQRGMSVLIPLCELLEEIVSVNLSLAAGE
jgi:DNA-binding FadR family transcriptional regulator